MERRKAAASWRASLGLLVTALALVLLVLAVWQAVWLNAQAAGDIPALQKERTAVAFQRILVPLSADIERFRLSLELLQNPPLGGANLRGRIDAEMRLADKYVAWHGAMLDVVSDWREIDRTWAQARTLQRPTNPAVLSKLIGGLGDLTYKLEDTSGLEYETNRFAQDLGDMLFARVPSAINDAMHSDLIAENAQARRSISIPDRVALSSLLDAMYSDFDVSTDDWDLFMTSVPKLQGTTAAEVAGYRADERAYFALGRNVLRPYLRTNVLLREVPSGTPATTRQYARDAVGAALTMNADLTTLLDRGLVRRMQLARARNFYLYLIALLSAVLLVGIMLLVAEFTSRREREALLKAQQESERLSAELAREKAERALRFSEAQFRAVFEGAALGIAILDRNGAVVDANVVFRSIFGGDSVALLAGHQNEFSELMDGERDLIDFEQHVMTQSGHEAWTAASITPVNDEAGRPYFAICTFRDVSELRRSQRRALHDMTHDALTGLPNRALFESKVREQFAEAKNSPEASFAVLVVDLDRFKDVNESLGHDAGDFVIAQAAKRLRAAIDSNDVVARLGSDEFAVLVHSLSDVLHVEVTARRALGALSKAIALGGRSIFVAASVGIAVASDDYQRGEDVIRDADIAMRYAKGGGGSRFALFDSKMHARAEKRLQLTTDLRLALEHGEFNLLYQPIVSLAGGELVGCEALLRWNHPTEGVMVPVDFMPLAEQTGLAIPIGRFVMRTACAQLAKWKQAVHRGRLFPMNVNVSAAELLDAEFESMLLATVREFDIDPADLTLEITESVVLDSGTRPNALVERLRGHGFAICIDDFGTGYSSLRYLQQFKVDGIKIDRSFVSGPDGDVASEPIVRTLMTLAEAFDVRVVAEGVETQRQRDVLRYAGCRYAQGYFFARALATDEFAAMYPLVFGLSARHASA